MSLPTRLENSDIKTDVSPFLFGHRSMFRAFLWLLVCNCLPFPARPSLFCFSGEVELYAFSFLCQGISLVNFSTSFAFFRPLVPSLHILRWLLFTSPGSVSVGTVSIHPMPPFPQGINLREFLISFLSRLAVSSGRINSCHRPRNPPRHRLQPRCLR